MTNDPIFNFMRDKFGESFEGYVALWGVQKSSGVNVADEKLEKRTEFFGSGELEQLALSAAKRAETENLYFGIGTQREKLSPYQRGGSAGVAYLPGLFADIDSAADKGEGEHPYPKDKQTAKSILDSFEVPPTSIIDSGNGLHAHWQFENGIVVKTAEERAHVQALFKAFQRKLKAHFLAHSYTIDDVSDLARVSRVPGTINHKKGEVKPVTLISHDPTRLYTASSIEEVVKGFMDDPKEVGKLTDEKSYPPADHERIMKNCSWYAEKIVENAASCKEPNWYAGASITGRCKNGKKIFHAYSSKHVEYKQGDADKKLTRAITEAGPKTCKTIRYDLGNENYCASCPHWGKITSPMQLGRETKKYETYDPSEKGPIPLGCTREGHFALRDQSRNVIVCAGSGQLLNVQYLMGLAHSSFWKKNYPNSKGGINSMAAGESIMEACRNLKGFNPTRIRGRGVWLEGEREILNFGDPIPPDVKYIYLCFDPIKIRTCDSYDAQRLLSFLELFNWRNPQDAMLLFGWLALAPICGVLKKRPHCFVYAPAGTGKTTINKVVSRVLHPLVIASEGGSTEAGLRQTLGPDSLPITIDEFESEHGQHRLRAIMKLARSAYSADTALLRGTPEGKALQFSLRTTFYLSSITPPGMEPADEARFIMLEMVMHDHDAHTERLITEEEEHFSGAESEWCGYMISHVAKVNPAIKIFQQVMTGLQIRHRDNMATLLAGAFIALHARIPTIEEARALSKEFTATVRSHGEVLNRNDGMDCFKYLMAHVVDRYPLWHWLAVEYRHLKSGKEDRSRESLRVLSNLGIKVRIDGDDAGFYILHKSPPIEKIFSTTKWVDGSWDRTLRQKSLGAFSPKIAPYFPIVGDKSRCIALPLELIPEPMEHEIRF